MRSVRGEGEKRGVRCATHGVEPKRYVYSVLRRDKGLAKVLETKLETFIAANPITPADLADAERFLAVHRQQMEGIRKICEETVPEKTETKVKQTHRLNNGTFNRIWRKTKAAYAS